VAALPEAKPPVADLEITLTDAVQMFNAPAVNPLSACVPEQRGMAGVDCLLEDLELRAPPVAPRELIVRLPAESAAPETAERLRQALKAHLAVRIERHEQGIRAAARYGWRVFALALVLLAVCLGLSSLFASEATEALPKWIRHTFEYGFEIVGWVMMWHPVEVLLFEPVRLRRKLRALQALAAATAVVQDRAA
jgi:hypothetical protein